MPRPIKTAALAGTQEDTGAKTRATVEGIIADIRARGDAAVRWILDHIPLGRAGTVDEVAPAAALVTGSSLLADGGWTAW